MRSMKILGSSCLAILLGLAAGVDVPIAEAQDLASQQPLRAIASMDGSMSTLAAIDDTRVLVARGHRIVMVEFRAPGDVETVAVSPCFGARTRHLIAGPPGWAYALTDEAELLALDLRQPDRGLPLASRQHVSEVFVGAYRLGGELRWSGGSSMLLLDDEPGLQIFDIAFPERPTRRSRVSLKPAGEERPLTGSLAGSGRRAYATTWHPAPQGEGYRTRLSVFDIEDPDRPLPLAEHWLGQRETLPDRPWLGAHGDLVFERWYDSINTFDLSDLQRLVVVPSVIGWRTDWSIIADDQLWAFTNGDIGGNRKVHRVDLGHPGRTVESFDSSVDTVYGLAATRDRLFVFKWYEVLALEPGGDHEMESRGRFPEPHGHAIPLAPAALGHHVYVRRYAQPSPNVQLLDISDAQRPRIAADFTFDLWSMEVRDGLAFGTNGEGLMVMNALEPDDLPMVARLDLPGGGEFVRIDDERGIVFSTEWIHLIDLRDPRTPRLRSSIAVQPDEIIIAMEAQGDRLAALIAVQRTGMRIQLYEVQRFSRPVPRAAIDLATFPLDLELFDERLITGDYDGLVVFDLTDLDHPAEVGRLIWPSYDGTVLDIVEHWGSLFVKRVAGLWEVHPVEGLAPEAWDVVEHRIGHATEASGLVVTHDRAYALFFEAGFYAFDRSENRLHLPMLSR